MHLYLYIYHRTDRVRNLRQKCFINQIKTRFLTWNARKTLWNSIFLVRERYDISLFISPQSFSFLIHWLKNFGKLYWSFTNCFRKSAMWRHKNKVWEEKWGRKPFLKDGQSPIFITSHGWFLKTLCEASLYWILIVWFINQSVQTLCNH